ncbi:MAG: hypothetical protein H0S78_13095 [Tissierellales bacterium]|nr:hypothetical protein [Tissierellales bacterium]
MNTGNIKNYKSLLNPTVILTFDSMVCLVIEDSEYGIEVVNRAGMYVVV